MQEDIVNYLREHPSSSKTDIKKGIGFNGSDATLKRIIKKSVDKGFIIACGEGRARRYSASVGYNQKRIFPDGIQTFEKIIQEGYVYVDKTEEIWELTHCGSQSIFLSRPRRFGKSLLISTLKAYFEGKKYLFNGLAIEELESKWESYPVVRLDLSSANNAMDSQQLYLKLGKILEENEDSFGVSHSDILPGERLYRLIKEIYEKKGKRIVLLIDEYDAPLLGTLYNHNTESVFKQIVKEFFSPIKKLDPFLHFTFISGITKFSQLSIFSALNNLRDISMEDSFATLCGFTEEEISGEFNSDVKKLSEIMSESRENIYEKLKQRYDGYHFSPSCVDTYNPYSVLRVFSSMKIADYWYSSGTPTVLIDTLKYFDTDLYDIDGVEVTSSVFNQPTETVTNAVSLFYQSGYLTIKEYDKDFDSYKLTIPNAEVRAGLMDNLLPILFKKNQIESQNIAIRFKRALLNDDISTAMDLLKAFFASIPYPEFGKGANSETRKEAYYKRLFYVVFSFMNIQIYTEVMNSEGRTDAIMFLADKIYVVEAKLDAPSAQEAIKQIDEKGYTERFLDSDKKIFKLGLNFSSKSRTIKDWVLKED